MRKRKTPDVSHKPVTRSQGRLQPENVQIQTRDPNESTAENVINSDTEVATGKRVKVARDRPKLNIRKSQRKLTKNSPRPTEISPTSRNRDGVTLMLSESPVSPLPQKLKLSSPRSPPPPQPGRYDTRSSKKAALHISPHTRSPVDSLHPSELTSTVAQSLQRQTRNTISALPSSGLSDSEWTRPGTLAAGSVEPNPLKGLRRSTRLQKTDQEKHYELQTKTLIPTSDSKTTKPSNSKIQRPITVESGEEDKAASRSGSKGIPRNGSHESLDGSPRTGDAVFNLNDVIGGLRLPPMVEAKTEEVLQNFSPTQEDNVHIQSADVTSDKGQSVLRRSKRLREEMEPDDSEFDDRRMLIRNRREKAATQISKLNTATSRTGKEGNQSASPKIKETSGHAKKARKPIKEPVMETTSSQPLLSNDKEQEPDIAQSCPLVSTPGQTGETRLVSTDIPARETGATRRSERLEKKRNAAEAKLSEDEELLPTTKTGKAKKTKLAAVQKRTTIQAVCSEARSVNLPSETLQDEQQGPTHDEPDGNASNHQIYVSHFRPNLRGADDTSDISGLRDDKILKTLVSEGSETVQNLRRSTRLDEKARKEAVTDVTFNSIPTLPDKRGKKAVKKGLKSDRVAISKQAKRAVPRKGQKEPELKAAILDQIVSSNQFESDDAEVVSDVRRRNLTSAVKAFESFVSSANVSQSLAISGDDVADAATDAEKHGGNDGKGLTCKQNSPKPNGENTELNGDPMVNTASTPSRQYEDENGIQTLPPLVEPRFSEPLPGVQSTGDKHHIAGEGMAGQTVNQDLPLQDKDLEEVDIIESVVPFDTIPGRQLECISMADEIVPGAFPSSPETPHSSEVKAAFQRDDSHSTTSTLRTPPVDLDTDKSNTFKVPGSTASNSPTSPSVNGSGDLCPPDELPEHRCSVTDSGNKSTLMTESIDEDLTTPASLSRADPAARVEKPCSSGTIATTVNTGDTTCASKEAVPISADPTEGVQTIINDPAHNPTWAERSSGSHIHQNARQDSVRVTPNTIESAECLSAREGSQMTSRRPSLPELAMSTDHPKPGLALFQQHDQLSSSPKQHDHFANNSVLINAPNPDIVNDQRLAEVDSVQICQPTALTSLTRGPSSSKASKSFAVEAMPSSFPIVDNVIQTSQFVALSPPVEVESKASAEAREIVNVHQQTVPSLGSSYETLQPILSDVGYKGDAPSPHISLDRPNSDCLNMSERSPDSMSSDVDMPDWQDQSGIGQQKPIIAELDGTVVQRKYELGEQNAASSGRSVHGYESGNCDLDGGSGESESCSQGESPTLRNRGCTQGVSRHRKLLWSNANVPKKPADDDDLPCLEAFIATPKTKAPQSIRASAQDIKISPSLSSADESTSPTTKLKTSNKGKILEQRQATATGNKRSPLASTTSSDSEDFRTDSSLQDQAKYKGRAPKKSSQRPETGGQPKPLQKERSHAVGQTKNESFRSFTNSKKKDQAWAAPEGLVATIPVHRSANQKLVNVGKAKWRLVASESKLGRQLEGSGAYSKEISKGIKNLKSLKLRIHQIEILRIAETFDGGKRLVCAKVAETVYWGWKTVWLRLVGKTIFNEALQKCHKGCTSLDEFKIWLGGQ